MDRNRRPSLSQTRFNHEDLLTNTERSNTSLILIKDLQRVLQDGVDGLDLPARISDSGAGISAHQSWTKNDG